MKSLSLSQPHAIVMLGIPGSGKTFFAEKFADTFGAPYVNGSRIAALAADPAAATEIIRLQVEELLKTKQTLILEIGGDARHERSELARYLRHGGYTPFFIWVQTDTETARLRNHKANGGNDQQFGTQIKRFSPPHASEKVVVISGKHTYASQARVVLKKLSAPRAHIAHPKPPVRPQGQSIAIQ